MQTRNEGRMHHALATTRMIESCERLAAVALMAWRAWWPLLVMAALYYFIAATLLPLKARDGMDLMAMFRVLAGLILVALTFFVIVRLGVYARQGFPPHPTYRLFRDIRRLLFNPARLLSLATLFPAIFVFLQAFSIAKGNIAHMNPFAWDQAFMKLDRLLHGGIDPWRYLEPAIAFAPATFLLNFFYNFWLLVSVGSLFWVALMRKPAEVPVRYLIAFMLAWVVGGNIIATLFSSAGPAYFSHLGLAPNPYAPLMETLRKVAEVVPVWALDTQELLWKGYLAQNTTLGGISAFPSMHNAQATLMALLAWRCNRKLGVVMTIYAVLIAIGSVWLGWHYAVDAYAGIAIAIACWWLAAPLARWMLRRKAMRELIALQERLDVQKEA